ncbi:winged helix DNA-binding domain-containing protein [Taibaiella koreensis]|uniref:winged helix DNA-binding domain-containing protein n=1 Tax=Taibaiella koreensis TaxID=1268548 RepID=UPI000E59D233|nr:winged helix DNA-binding domain-containing protein [Taibaiella koreensis]
MNQKELLRYRLQSQRLLQPAVGSAQELVSWMGAVQAQDYAMCKWALGVRLPSADDALIEAALESGELIRTHVLRPTWHLVAPADVRWMLQLTAPRIHAYAQTYYRKAELDQKIFTKAHKVLERILHGKHLDRTGIKTVFTKAGINTDDLRLTHILLHAELEGLICNGPRIGKQIGYALLEERVPAVATIDNDEALAMLARRYFQSHGPATEKDFSWWSGLSLTQARKGIGQIVKEMEKVSFGGQDFWFIPPALDPVAKTTVYLLPNYDEYTVAYADRALLMSQEKDHTISRDNPLFSNTIIVDGKVRGTWKRSIKKDSVAVATESFEQLPATRRKQLDSAIEQYNRFLFPSQKR